MRGRVLLLLLGLVGGLVAAEVATRLVDDYHCLLPFSGNFWEPDPLYGWRHTPGAFGWAKSCLAGRPEWETFTRINSLGLRDREIPYARGAAYRVLVLGDSFTEGMQVDSALTFPKLIERQLNDPDRGARRVEVINAGISGFGTDNELLFYRAEGRRYHPDLVLLAFDTHNDILENSASLIRREGFLYGTKPYFVLEGARLAVRDFPVPQPPRRAALREALERSLMRHCVLCRFLKTLDLPHVVSRAHAEPPRTPSILGVLLKRYPPEWREAWRVTYAVLRRLDREVRHDGARLAVVVINSPHEVSESRLARQFALRGLPSADYDADKADRLVTRLLTHRRIPHVALLSTFREHFHTTGESGYFEWDPHWTAAGHALAATPIVRGLLAEGLLPAPTAHEANTISAR